MCPYIDDTVLLRRFLRRVILVASPSIICAVPMSDMQSGANSDALHTAAYGDLSDRLTNR